MKITAAPLRELFQRAERACNAIEWYLDDLDAADEMRRLGSEEHAASFERPDELLPELAEARLRFNRDGSALGSRGREGELNAALYFMNMANAETVGFARFGFHEMAIAHSYAIFAASALSKIEPAKLPTLLRSADEESREIASADDEGAPADYLIPPAKYLRIDIGRAQRRLPREFAVAVRLLILRNGSIDSSELIGASDASERQGKARVRGPERRTAKPKGPSAEQRRAVRDIVANGGARMKRDFIIRQLQRDRGAAMRPETLGVILDELRAEGLYKRPKSRQP